MAPKRSRKPMISFRLLVYDQAHARLPRVFNNLAVSYDQAHGTYDQAHGRKIPLHL
jgi:hypothetical protein